MMLSLILYKFPNTARAAPGPNFSSEPGTQKTGIGRKLEVGTGKQL